MNELQSRFVETNGIQMHLVEQGAGPAVILCHGWPESWYSWRHQIGALAAAGFRAIVPDQRGYGQTDAPQPVESYDILNLVSDIVGLVNTLELSEAVIVGHDWGAPVAWHSALLRPDLFKACVLLSVPYIAVEAGPRIKPSETWRALEGGDKWFYQNYFQEPGRAEAYFEADVRRTMKKALYGASGDAPMGERFEHLFPRDKRPLDMIGEPKTLPSWLTDRDVDFFTNEFERAGFRGGLNWYRNIDRNAELTTFLAGAKLRQPSMFAAGDQDVVLRMIPNALQLVELGMPNCRSKTVIPGAGHWIQQERPREINELLVTFLKSL